MEEKPRRRWLTFSLRTLLAAVTMLAIALSWYVSRTRILAAERARLAGTWVVVQGPNNRKIGIFIDFLGEKKTVLMPREGVGQIDYHGNEGIMRAIYRIDGNTIEVCTGWPGCPRPLAFEKGKDRSLWRAVRLKTKP